MSTSDVKRVQRKARRVLAKRKERAILKEQYREFDRLNLIDERIALGDKTDPFVFGADEPARAWFVSSERDDIAAVSRWLGRIGDVPRGGISGASLLEEHYRAYPFASQVTKWEAKIDALGILHLRIGFSDGKEAWIEEWSYNGKFTIQWARE